jgi:predicted DNA-binding transcriptional regulator AlpA
MTFTSPPQVSKQTSLSKTQLLRMSENGLFPAPVRLSQKRIAWVAEEVDRWMAERIAAKN